MMVKAASVLLKRRWAKSSCRRSRAISACSAVGRPILAPADLPARTPPSRSRRHSVIWEEYRPCWRRYAPPWPWVRAASYAARCSSFCAGVNDRRRVGPPKRGCEGSIRPSCGTGVSVEELIRNQSESRPAWDGLAMNRWPQPTLTRRARMAEVGLMLHPVKTKIVYCKDNGRRGSYEHESFTFLGYTFRARSALDKHGAVFASFIPAVSRVALKVMGQRVRGWC